MFYFHNGLHRKFFLHVISNHTQQKAGNGVEFPLILYSHHNQSWYATYFTYCPVSTCMKNEENKICWNYLHFKSIESESSDRIESQASFR